MLKHAFARLFSKTKYPVIKASCGILISTVSRKIVAAVGLPRPVVRALDFCVQATGVQTPPGL